LSVIDITRLCETTVALGGSGWKMRMVCSPCTSLTQSAPVRGSRHQNPGLPSTVAMVGTVRRSFS
jgi:hypothetical protein